LPGDAVGCPHGIEPDVGQQEQRAGRSAIRSAPVEHTRWRQGDPGHLHADILVAKVDIEVDTNAGQVLLTGVVLRSLLSRPRASITPLAEPCSDYDVHHDSR
jgi:hypothetical protein